jgi:protein-tyrosine sulfotransferase
VTTTPVDPAKGIVVFGCPRSGTTLLRRLLNAHGSIACPGETNLLSACARFLSSSRGSEGIPVGVLSGLGLAGFARSEILSRLRTFAFKFHEDLSARSGKRRWAEKSAFDSFCLPAIEELCGDTVQYVCVVRHALDVVCSLKDFTDKSEGYLFQLHDYIRRFPRPHEAFAHAWADATTSIIEFTRRRPEDSCLIRYEDLATDPEGELQRMFRFLGEPWEEGLIGRALIPGGFDGFDDWKSHKRACIDTSSIGRWRKLLPKLSVNRLAGIVNPCLAECGYEPLVTPGAPSDDDLLRRYELGILLNKRVQKG